MHVTIVDDVNENLELYKELLSDSFNVSTFQNPDTLITHLDDSNDKTDLILMDVHMPKIDGFQLFDRFKKTHPNLPVIFLTGDASEDKIVRGMEMGADDYIIKPVSLNVLVAKIKNKIKRAKEKASTPNKISIENFTLHMEMQMAEIDGKRISLTPTEFKLIHLFIKSPNKVFSREFVIRYLWPDVYVQNQNLDTHLSNLRRKLKPFSSKLKTIKSRGYILRV